MPRNDTPGAFSRRHMLAATAGAGVASVAGAALLPSAAHATEPTRTPAQEPAHAAAAEPVVAHVQDAATGQVVLFQGTRRVEVHDPQLAALLVRAARG